MSPRQRWLVWVLVAIAVGAVISLVPLALGR